MLFTAQLNKPVNKTNKKTVPKWKGKCYFEKHQEKVWNES